MSAIPSPCWSWARSRRRPARSGSKLSRWKSDERRISRPPSRHSKAAPNALYVCTDALANTNRIRINIAAVGEGRPTMHGSRDYVEAGGLMSYGPNFPDMFRRTADYVDKILRGAKPGDLPVEQPTKFELVINLQTAKTLGIEVPPTLLARADEVIE
jgi:putative tryptophan/tyrosine transport system substrate-binding protein